MPKRNVSELEGDELDDAVALAAGMTFLAASRQWTWKDERGYAAGAMSHSDWFPSENWAQAGPIIERERISVYRGAHDDDTWCATLEPIDTDWVTLHATELGPTQLVAAMRAPNVTSKLGPEVELP